MTSFTARPTNPPLTMADQYSAPPATCAPYSTTKSGTPLPEDWTYGNAVDLLNLNPMMSNNSFGLDLPEDLMSMEPKDFNVDPFGQQSFAPIPDQSAEDVMSSELSSVCTFFLLSICLPACPMLIVHG